MRCLILLFAVFACLNAGAQGLPVTVEVDATQTGGAIRDLFGANKKPTANSQTPGTSWDGISLYPAFGVSQIRLHDAGVDLCGTYTAATKLNAGVSPPQPVSGCTLSGTGSRPHFSWTPTSVADADLNNPNNYDFSAVDEAISGALATGATIYLRLGESYNGPNDTADPVAWAKVATNIYRHVIGVFKPTAGIAVDPAFVEIFNEPDGGFWAGDVATFNTLFIETASRVRAAAAVAGRTVKVGGAGFTRNVLTTSAQAGNPANGFIASVGASTLDFYSAHLYNNCANATLAGSATFLRNLRNMVNGQGGSAKPLHITEWNIGLGSQCGDDFFSNQRTQSFASGLLTLMQDPAQNIEAAHFYAAMPIMALFNFTAVSGKVRVVPAAWSVWAHSRLRGAARIGTQICAPGSACVAGHAAESAPLLALAGQGSSGPSIVVTNDGTSTVSYTLHVKGLSPASVTATISTPPAGAQDVVLVGNPAAPDPAALSALMASIGRETRSSLVVSGGTVDLDLTVPAQSIQLVEIRSSSANSSADCLFDWAERRYPQYFAPAGAHSAAYAPYYYRYYPGTGNYLASSASDASVWVLGPMSGNRLMNVGTLNGLLATAGCTQ